MKKLHLLGTMLLLCAGALSAFSQVSNDNEDEVYKIDARARYNDFVPGQVLVKFKDESLVNVSRARGQFRSVNNNAVDAVLKEFGVKAMDKLLPNERPNNTRRKTRALNGQMVEERDLSQLYFIKMDNQNRVSTMQLVEKLKELDVVDYAEPNYKVYMLEEAEGEICSNPTQNPLYKEQWGIGRLNISAMWNLPLVNRRRPVIAIVDTGVDINHPDLKDNIWINPKEGDGNSAQDDDENGYVDDINGWNFIDNYLNVSDDNGHGTHVAGIAAACNNALGIVGANPFAYIMPVKVLNSDGSGDIATAARGIVYAAENGADIINMSFGSGPELPSTMKDALDKAFQKSILVAAAGNNMRNIYDNSDPSAPGTIYPAAYYCVLGVQAIDQDGNLPYWTNYDPDGPFFSRDGVDGRNYEIKAPGVSIISTMTDGGYRSLNGTSMASPLVAGAISALQMVKDYGNREMLFGDLIHLECDFAKIVDNSLERGTGIDFVALRIDDSEGNGDGYLDAGEKIKLYPTIRNTWRNASNIKLNLKVDDLYSDYVAITSNNVDLGFSPSYYGQDESKNPLIIQLANSIANGTRIKMKLIITADDMEVPYETEFIQTVNNIVKLNGIIAENTTLKADKNYLVLGTIGVLDGVTLTIEPGTTLQFEHNGGINIATGGKLVAKGLPGKMIVFTRSSSASENGYGWNRIDFSGNRDESDIMSYCIFEYATMLENNIRTYPYYDNCILRHFQFANGGIGGTNPNTAISGNACNIVDNENIELDTWVPREDGSSFYGTETYLNFNIINNFSVFASHYLPQWQGLNHSNCFNNRSRDGHCIQAAAREPQMVTNQNPSYLGTTKEDLIRPYIFEIGNFKPGGATTSGYAVLSNMLKEPVKEAHGIVWKVVVNGKDAQDEYEDLDPLGVGKHKFEVYFNRPMNKEKIPQISFGVREPYTQNAVAEDGNWNEEGTIYTAYVTITGKTQSDGINRIYVYGAEDDEYFECPYEKTRFNVNVQSAGSQSTGFIGEAGLGRVELDWNELKTDMTDVLGFNVYRYTKTPEDSVRVNDVTIDAEETHFTDYDIKPGTTYYYKYKVQSTDLREYQTSNVVAVTPLTAKLGDVTGNNEVDVFDVVSEVNYILGQKPKQFVKCAADVNEDNSIDILDVQGIIRKILDPSAAARTKSGEISAIYSIEDGILYVESPVALGGIQVQINVPEQTDITATDELKGFEQAGSWLSKNDYLFLAYSMNGKTLSAGKHALLKIGNGQVTNIILGDATAKRVQAIPAGDVTKVEALGSAVRLQKGVYNLKGQKVAGSTKEFDKLPKGVYIIEGVKVVK